jgi:hypothetical protein
MGDIRGGKQFFLKDGQEGPDLSSKGFRLNTLTCKATTIGRRQRHFQFIRSLPNSARHAAWVALCRYCRSPNGVGRLHLGPGERQEESDNHGDERHKLACFDKLSKREGHRDQ